MATYHIRDVDNRVEGRLALVTGASGGIGSAIARALAAEGCDVVLHCNASLHKVEALSKELTSAHPGQLFPCVSADLSSRDETRGLVDKVFQDSSISAKHKAVSILVANAGLGRRIRDIQNIEEDDWDSVMEVNARSQFVVVKACLPAMRAQSWGRVVLVGSIASTGGGINGCHYAATKGALSSMGKNLSTVLAGEGVTVNTILPAMIGFTDMIPTPKETTWTRKTDLEELKETDPGLAIAASVPVRRLGHPQEVANIAVMMAKTGYLTGQDIILSGGLK
ncbi:3-oxoacyl-[acyl-carrier-protein] reductase FabG [Fusarium oxysporum f. sp. cubense]|uniref:3-oxoacyl-[acyl-carrier-protein] reductase FabG n=1 Tax=Fusarium oxysporum f. sp. cubense TaxID=61366 RepID=A0A559LE72_FUSOC|nr:3-oxoacyl-[acyl-carrier-protein] reductase FabG [Fusarium oxysporum f. sp. cubense]